MTIDHGNTHESENTYIKELQRNIRNVSKKLTSMHKVDSIIANNPGLSLEELVAAKKINNDQKAQALKKPLLQQSLQQFEEQLAKFKKFEQECNQQHIQQIKQLKLAHDAVVDNLQNSIRKETLREVQEHRRNQLLTLSCFLRAAAGRRAIDTDAENLSEESRAFEGALLLLYGGNITAVEAAERLVTGSKDQVVSTEGEILNVTYETIKALSLKDSLQGNERFEGQEKSHMKPSEHKALRIPHDIDQTRAHATLTELDDPHTNPKNVSELDTVCAPPQSVVEQESASKTALDQWSITMERNSNETTDGWIAVPKDFNEAETVSHAMGSYSISSWVSEAAETGAENASTQPQAEDSREVYHGQAPSLGEGAFQEHGYARGRGGPRQADESAHKNRGNARGDRSRARGARTKGMNRS